VRPVSEPGGPGEPRVDREHIAAAQPLYATLMTAAASCGSTTAIWPRHQAEALTTVPADPRGDAA